MSGFATARQKMVDGQVRTSDVTDIRILDAMLALPREAFVPERLRAVAYLDRDLEFREEGASSRFLIKPAVSAKMLQAAEIKDTDWVLVAGTAPAYTAGLAARLASQVIATESDANQAAKAKEVLAQFGLANVTFTAAAPARGDPENAPYDVIVIEGATEIEPTALLGQLSDGGRLVCLLGGGPAGKAVLYKRSGEDVGERPLFDAGAGVLPGFAKPPAFAF